MRRHLVFAAMAALCTTTAARADELSLGGRDLSKWPQEITHRPLTLGAGMVEVWAPVQLNASKDADWKPVTSNPSLAFGVTDQWTLGLRHIVGLCFGGTDDGCPEVYNDVGLFTRFSLGRSAGVDVAVQAALDVNPIQDPRGWDGQAGLLLRFGGGALGLTLAPSVSFGLSDRDTRPGRNFNTQWNLGTYDWTAPSGAVGGKEHLSLPATLQLQLGPTVALAVGAALEGPLNPEVGSFSDFYRIPVGAAIVFTPSRWFDVGAAFSMPAFAGENDTRDLRFVSAFVALRI